MWRDFPEFGIWKHFSIGVMPCGLALILQFFQQVFVGSAWSCPDGFKKTSSAIHFHAFVWKSQTNPSDLNFSNEHAREDLSQPGNVSLVWWADDFQLRSFAIFMIFLALKALKHKLKRQKPKWQHMMCYRAFMLSFLSNSNRLFVHVRQIIHGRTKGWRSSSHTLCWLPAFIFDLYHFCFLFSDAGRHVLLCFTNCTKHPNTSKEFCQKQIGGEQATSTCKR